MIISFCIPTKNFGSYIGQSIQSILDEFEDQKDFEIVVLDSGSTDNTAQIISNFQNKYSNINYIYEEKAEGVDKAIAKVISHAKAPYCWLVSADDALVKGAVRKILNEINNQPNVILCNRFWCDINLNTLRREFWRQDSASRGQFNFSDKNHLKSYLDKVISLGGLFSFMSSIIIKKSAWDEVDFKQKYLGTNYAHVPRLIEMSKSVNGLTYIHENLILCRSGNDSFRQDGLLGRMLIDCRAYYQFGQDFFEKEDELRSLFYNVLIREHGYKRWLKAFFLSSSTDLISEAVTLIKKLGYPRFFCTFLSAIASTTFYLKANK